jgi:hypothetical protein
MPRTILRKLLRREGSQERSSARSDRRGGPPDWVMPGATIDMWFAKSLYFGAAPANLGVLRDSPGYADDGRGGWAHFGNGVARITARGLLVEDGCTNMVLWCRDLTNAVWTTTGITALKTQAGFDGTPAAATSLVATTPNATILQRIADDASVQRQQSAFVKRLSGSGPIEMTMDGGTTWTNVRVGNIWTRVSIPAQTLANPTIGLRLANRGDSIAVDCVQNEKLTGVRAGLSAVSSPIPTTAASADRAADIVALSSVPSISTTAASMYCAGVLIGHASMPTAYPYLCSTLSAPMRTKMCSDLGHATTIVSGPASALLFRATAVAAQPYPKALRPPVNRSRWPARFQRSAAKPRQMVRSGLRPGPVRRSIRLPLSGSGSPRTFSRRRSSVSGVWRCGPLQRWPTAC